MKNLERQLEILTDIVNDITKHTQHILIDTNSSKIEKKTINKAIKKCNILLSRLITFKQCINLDTESNIRQNITHQGKKNILENSTMHKLDKKSHHQLLTNAYANQVGLCLNNIIYENNKSYDTKNKIEGEKNILNLNLYKNQSSSELNFLINALMSKSYDNTISDKNFYNLDKIINKSDIDYSNQNSKKIINHKPKIKDKNNIISNNNGKSAKIINNKTKTLNKFSHKSTEFNLSYDESQASKRDFIQTSNSSLDELNGKKQNKKQTNSRKQLDACSNDLAIRTAFNEISNKTNDEFKCSAVAMLNKKRSFRSDVNEIDETELRNFLKDNPGQGRYLTQANRITISNLIREKRKRESALLEAKEANERLLSNQLQSTMLNTPNLSPVESARTSFKENDDNLSQVSIIVNNDDSVFVEESSNQSKKLKITNSSVMTVEELEQLSSKKTLISEIEHKSTNLNNDYMNLRRTQLDELNNLRSSHKTRLDTLIKELREKNLEEHTVQEEVKKLSEIHSKVLTDISNKHNDEAVELGRLIADLNARKSTIESEITQLLYISTNLEPNVNSEVMDTSSLECLNRSQQSNTKSNLSNSNTITNSTSNNSKTNPKLNKTQPKQVDNLNSGKTKSDQKSSTSTELTNLSTTIHIENQRPPTKEQNVNLTTQTLTNTNAQPPLTNLTVQSASQFNFSKNSGTEMSNLFNRVTVPHNTTNQNSNDALLPINQQPVQPQPTQPPSTVNSDIRQLENPCINVPKQDLQSKQSEIGVLNANVLSKIDPKTLFKNNNEMTNILKENQANNPSLNKFTNKHDNIQFNIDPSAISNNQYWQIALKERNDKIDVAVAQKINEMKKPIEQRNLNLLPNQSAEEWYDIRYCNRESWEVYIFGNGLVHYKDDMTQRHNEITRCTGIKSENILKSQPIQDYVQNHLYYKVSLKTINDFVKILYPWPVDAFKHGIRCTRAPVDFLQPTILEVDRNANLKSTEANQALLNLEKYWSIENVKRIQFKNLKNPKLPEVISNKLSCNFVKLSLLSKALKSGIQFDLTNCTHFVTFGNIKLLPICIRCGEKSCNERTCKEVSCYKCLDDNHIATACTNGIKCRNCAGPHLCSSDLCPVLVNWSIIDKRNKFIIDFLLGEGIISHPIDAFGSKIRLTREEYDNFECGRSDEKSEELFKTVNQVMTIINPLIESHSTQLSQLNIATKSNTEQIASNSARISTCENNIESILSMKDMLKQIHSKLHGHGTD